MSERERKIEKIFDQLKKEFEKELDGDENFVGKIAFEFNIQSGGISGPVRISKERKVAM